jgi:hypothetical protein
MCKVFQITVLHPVIETNGTAVAIVNVTGAAIRLIVPIL